MQFDIFQPFSLHIAIHVKRKCYLFLFVQMACKFHDDLLCSRVVILLESARRLLSFFLSVYLE